jgi:uncharacterized protein involved in tellurium resistance
MKSLQPIKRLPLLALTLICMLTAGFLLSSCDDDEGGAGDIRVNSFGPSPVMRGGQLKFIGTNLDKVTAILLSGNVEVTSFVTKTSNLIVIEIPEETVDGLVTIKTPQGDIITQTILGIAEPITITSISPASARPGETIVLQGTYLNLVEEIIFTNNISVTEFENQSNTSLSIIVPEDAQTGSIILSDGEDVPNLIESEIELQVILPEVTGFSPKPVKPGAELTLSGTNLDLVKDITFEGGARVASDLFVSQSEAEIVLEVPANAKEGTVVLRPASAVEVEVAESLVLLAPVISSFTPNPGKNGNNLTVTGTDLDLVTTVVFGGGAEGTIQNGRTDTELIVKVPADATESVLTFNTQNRPVVTESEFTLVVPTISNISPLSVNTADDPSITITGTDLDLVQTIVFGGENWLADIGKAISASPTQIQIPVTPGSISGNIKIITSNGQEVISTQSLTIVPEVPNITSLPSEAFMGTYILLQGTNMNVPAEIIFPGDVKATSFGAKTSTEIKVLVPSTVSPGEGRIKFVTYKNEVYESPLLAFKFPGPEPIADPALIINDFDETGHDLGWDNWGGNVELGNNTSLAVSGKYLHGTNASATGWTWIWGCNHGELPKPSVTTADHVFKMDVKITSPIPAGVNFEMEFAGTRISLGNLGGSTPGGGWITITYDLADFAQLPATIPASGEWGINLGSGTVDLTGLYIDNIRFQAK